MKKGLSDEELSRLRKTARLRFPVLYNWYVKIKSKKISLLLINWYVKIKSKKISPLNEFTKAYKTRAWGSVESGSGSGSELRATENLRIGLPIILKSLECKIFLDAPCGDWHWMSHIKLPVETYFGADIVPEVIEENIQRYSTDRIRFIKCDLRVGMLPKADFILCRDCFVHLSFEDIFSVLRNFKKTNADYLFSNTYEVTINVNQVTGIPWRELNLFLPPFNFPGPLKTLRDGGKVNPKLMALWKFDDLPL